MDEPSANLDMKATVGLADLIQKAQGTGEKPSLLRNTDFTIFKILQTALFIYRMEKLLRSSRHWIWQNFRRSRSRNGDLEAWN